MMKLRLVIILFLATLGCRALSGQGTVRGNVSEAGSGEALPGVSVIYGDGKGVATDISGNYTFKTDQSQITVQYQFVGYRTAVRNVRIREGEVAEVNVVLEPDVKEIDQVIVSASKTGERVADITVSAAVIKPFEIGRNHLTDPQELINKTSGIEVLDGQASIRGGSGFSYGAGSRVLALIDGLPVLSPDAGNIKWQFLPLENISQIEVIKGASSVLYGSSALNGIINFRTADPTPTGVTRFFLEAGVFGKPSREEWKWWDSPRVYSSGSFSHSHLMGKTGIGIGLNLLSDNGYRRLNGEKLARLSLRIKQESAKKEGLSYGVNINSGYTRKTDFLLWEDAATGALKQDPGTAQELDGMFLAIDPFVSFEPSERVRHDIRMRVQSTSNRFVTGNNNNSDAFALFAEYQLWMALRENISITAGLAENMTSITANLYGNHKGNNIAAYSQIDYRLAERIKLSAGVRVEQNSLDSDLDDLVPVFRAGLNYRVAEYTYLRGSFGQGYRYPSVAEKFANTTAGSVRIFPEPFVRPESGWSSEIGIKQGILLGEWTGQADLALFYSQNKDMIEYIFGSYTDPVTGFSGPGFRATNVENSRIYGMETEVVINRLMGNVNVTTSLGYTFIYPVEYNSYTGSNTGVFLKYRRKHSLKLSADGRYRKVLAGLAAYYKSALLNIDDVFLSPTTGEQILPGFPGYWATNNKGYLLLDLNTGYLLSDNLTLSFVVKNATNTEYMGRPGDIQPHRNFSLRISGRF